MRCFIFVRPDEKGYGYLGDVDFSKELVICADGGYKAAMELGIIPDLWIGDGDSLGECEISAAKSVRYPAEKDNTDTELAVEAALSRGCDEIVIVGGIGGRIDHEFANLCLLKKITDSGARGVMQDSKNIITMENEPFTVSPCGRKYISFFPFGGDVYDFSVKGLKYEAENIRLGCDMTLAVSNCFEGENAAQVSFKGASLLVICSDD